MSWAFMRSCNPVWPNAPLPPKRVERKTCRVCAKELPSADFYRQPMNKDGLANLCKPCFRDERKARYVRLEK